MSDLAQIATLDHGCPARNSLPEIVYAEGKTPGRVALLLAELHARGGSTLATRATPEHVAAVQTRLPQARCRDG